MGQRGAFLAFGAWLTGGGVSSVMGVMCWKRETRGGWREKSWHGDGVRSSCRGLSSGETKKKRTRIQGGGGNSLNAEPVFFLNRAWPVRFNAGSVRFFFLKSIRVF